MGYLKFFDQLTGKTFDTRKNLRLTREHKQVDRPDHSPTGEIVESYNGNHFEDGFSEALERLINHKKKVRAKKA